MKYFKTVLQISSLVLLAFLLSSCGEKKEQAEEKTLAAADVEKAEMAKEQKKPVALPRQFQRPAYMIGDEIQIAPEGQDNGEIILKVGATIRSTTGPQPLWDIIKRLAAMKNMNVSWESDVDQAVLVDVDINAQDDFYKALDNLLRQVDYFHEMQENTIVIKYKETRQYHVGIPHTKQLYETATGGNLIGGNNNVKKEDLQGTIRLASEGNTFDIWQNIEDNLNAILNVWETEAITELEAESVSENERESENEILDTDQKEESSVKLSATTRRRSSNQNLYTIDRNIGLVSVTAPRPLLDKLDVYFGSLKKQLYKQIAIEAKIVEVALTDASSIGINWSSVLKNFSVSGVVEFGSQALGGQVWPYIFSGNDGPVVYEDGSYQNRDYDPTRFISRITLGNAPFDIFLNALKEEGETKVLSNPKISVLNGQPALITVGKNVTYIESIESDLDTDSGIITLDVNTDRILSGIGMALTATIIEDDEIIMNLVPVTSALQEPIEYRDVGNLGGTVGLPVVDIREMSTTVRVKNGEMLVIGGLISDDKDEKGEFLPLMGEIPLIRYLFGYEEKSHTKRELIILLKPVVI